MTKKIINVTERANIKYLLEGSLQSALEEIQTLIQQYGEDATIEIGTEYEEYSDDKDAYVRVHKHREETDAEYQKRLTDENKYKTFRENQERQQYEALRKKFGDS